MTAQSLEVSGPSSTINEEPTVAGLAKALLDFFGPKGEHWGKKYLAKYRTGGEASVTSNNAHKFCIGGALLRLGIAPYNKVFKKFKVAMLKGTSFDYLVDYNDSKTYREIKSKLMELTSK